MSRKALFRENLVTKEYIYAKMFLKMCINKFNLQYHVTKY
jgi:hypothetical protein